MNSQSELELRTALFHYVDRLVESYGDTLSYEVLSRRFEHSDVQFRLIQQRGIFKPAALGANGGALIVLSQLDSPYEDEHDKEVLSYAYETGGPYSAGNRALREALNNRLPLLFLRQVGRQRYMPLYPTYVISDNPATSRVQMAVANRTFTYDAQRAGSVVQQINQAFRAQMVRQRIGQGVFRTEVLHVYRKRCAICRLQIEELLDAAHIIPYSENGESTVQNGLSLCKIHHRAYDLNIIGINNEAVVHVHERILDSSDGPMLQYGIKDIHEIKLELPTRLRDRPDPSYLNSRYQRFIEQP